MIVSKFRDLYLAKFAFFLLLSIVVLIVCSYFLFQDLSQKDFVTILTIEIFSFCVFVFILFELVNMKSINISETEIRFINIFSNKSKEIYFKDIKTITREKVNGLHTKPGVKISDDYFQTKIIYKNNLEVIISPHDYENYLEIIKEINFRLKKFN